MRSFWSEAEEIWVKRGATERNLLIAVKVSKAKRRAKNNCKWFFA